MIMVVIVLDILIFVKFPTLYRSISSINYTILTSTPVFLFGFITAFYGWLSRTEDVIASCSPPFIFDQSASVIYKYLFIFFSFLVLILYIILIRAFYRRSQNTQKSLKTVKRLQLSVLIYIFTWFFSQVFSLVILKITENSVGGGMIFAHVTLNVQIVNIYKPVFFVLGTIGNLLFIHLILRRKALQSRTSILQCFQCIFHIFCLVGTLLCELVATGSTFTRRECFNRIGFYVFFQAAQCIIMVVIVLDILILVKFPIWYRSISSINYVILASTPVVLFSFSTAAYGYLFINDDYISSCNPPYVYDITASLIYKYLFVFFSLVVFITYIILIRSFHQRSDSNQNSLKTVKRLQLSVLIYVFTWLFSQILSLIILELSEYSVDGGVMFMHINLFVSLSYSNTFYVTIWRSKEYRDQFYSVWCPKLMQKTDVNSVSHGLRLAKNNFT
uniref:G_PROTEIN_RECEP_F1_2 domain-containing protein n=1 Tax=Caenorhabditis tropicalis TaxID=1561998 RepID=A0A1I7SZQ9_9PELO